MSAVMVDDGTALALFEANQGLVRLVVARRSRSGSADPEEMRQDGLVGLWHACQRFDVARGVRLSSFAYAYIDGYVLHGLRLRAGVNERQGRHATVVSLDALLPGSQDQCLGDLLADEAPNTNTGVPSDVDPAAFERVLTSALALCRDDLDESVVWAVADGRRMRDVAEGVTRACAQKRKQRLAARAQGGVSTNTGPYRRRNQSAKIRDVCAVCDGEPSSLIEGIDGIERCGRCHAAQGRQL